jgi:GNAT superfamily N-acetyltransferase
VNRSIRGLAVSHYPRDAIEGWVVPVTDETLRDLMLNRDHEVRLVAELDGKPVGIGALIVERSELRACYVAPQAARRGCGSALVQQIERRQRRGESVGRFRPVGGSMTKMRAVIRFLFAVGSFILSALMRAAQRWAAPGAGSKVVSG